MSLTIFILIIGGMVLLIFLWRRLSVQGKISLVLGGVVILAFWWIYIGTKYTGTKSAADSRPKSFKEEIERIEQIEQKMEQLYESGLAELYEREQEIMKRLSELAGLSEQERQKINRLGYSIGYSLGKEDVKNVKRCRPSQAFVEHTALIQRIIGEYIKIRESNFDWRELLDWNTYFQNDVKKEIFKKGFEKGYRNGWTSEKKQRGGE